MSSLKKGVSIYLFSNILNSLIPFLLLPVLTRYLSPAQYGEIAIFLTLIAAYGAFAGSTFVGAINRKFFDGLAGNEYANYVGAGLQIIAAFSLLTAFFTFVFADELSNFLGISNVWLNVAMLVAFLKVIIEIRLGQWQVRKRSGAYGSLQVSLSLINALLSIGAIVWLGFGPEGRMGAIFFATFIGALVSIFLLLHSDLLSIHSKCLPYWREILFFGLPLIPHVAGGFLLNSVDRFVIASQIDLATAGLYMAGLQLVMIASVIFDAVNKAYAPWLFEKLNANDSQEKVRIVIGSYVWFCVIWIGVLTAFYIGPALIELLLGSEFSGAAEFIGWLAIGQAFKGMYLMVTNYCFYAKKTGYLSMFSILTGCLNLFLLFFLVNSYGAIGAAYAYAIAMAVRFFLVWWHANKCHPMPWFKFMSIR
ncbi:lipopolysaccharide biosynthesis protein [Neptuniibacter sp. QD29_5]|uniref:lipopolysaccharide biosynthesis protein n=1 Tax=Neptuniibacter sp. QD29_5 TaxID=3398207 RepID=UPI0039F4A822